MCAILDIEFPGFCIVAEWYEQNLETVLIFLNLTTRSYLKVKLLYNKTNIDFYFRFIRGYLDPPEKWY